MNEFTPVPEVVTGHTKVTKTFPVLKLLFQ